MSKINLKTSAYHEIKRRIITNEYPPGAFLNEEILTEDLNISRTPIRDALGRLEQEGLVIIMPKKGIAVTKLTMKDINMIYEVRALYEPYILRTYGNSLQEERLMEFYKLFSQSQLNKEPLQSNAYYYELDNNFHQMIVDTCPNSYIKQSYNQTTTQAERFRFLSGNAIDTRLEDTFQEHNEIITACLQKDWEVAVERLLNHLEESKKATFQLAFDSMVDM